MFCFVYSYVGYRCVLFCFHSCVISMCFVLFPFMCDIDIFYLRLCGISVCFVLFPFVGY